VEGRSTQWPRNYSLALDQPILDFTVPQILYGDFWANAGRVFEHWLAVENENLTRVRAGLLTYRMPDGYRTNDVCLKGWVTHPSRTG
jgi:hypothetical protein